MNRVVALGYGVWIFDYIIYIRSSLMNFTEKKWIHPEDEQVIAVASTSDIYVLKTFKMGIFY